MSAIEEKSLKVIVFSGKQDDWRFWEVKFLVHACCKGFRELLLGNVTIPKDSAILNAMVLAEKKQIDIRKANELAFEELVLSINTSQPAIAFLEEGIAWSRLAVSLLPSLLF